MLQCRQASAQGAGHSSSFKRYQMSQHYVNHTERCRCQGVRPMTYRQFMRLVRKLGY